MLRLDFEYVTALVSRKNLFSGRCQRFRITVIPVAYALLCLRFTCLVRG
jgi:hypothetical protein